jgi:hypothetical protein
MTMSKELIKDLKALLKKHNASIQFNCSDCSDTYGLIDERIEITVCPDPKKFNEKVVASVHGWHMTARDL